MGENCAPVHGDWQHKPTNDEPPILRKKSRQVGFCGGKAQLLWSPLLSAYDTMFAVVVGDRHRSKSVFAIMRLGKFQATTAGVAGDMINLFTPEFCTVDHIQPQL